VKILLVEDDETTVVTIKLSLKIFHPNVSLTTIGSGQAAIEMIKHEQFNMVFLDLGLQDMDGTEVLKQIRSFSQVPVTIVSSRTSDYIH